MRPKSVIIHLIDKMDINLAECIKWLFYGIALVIIACAFLISTIQNESTPVAALAELGIEAITQEVPELPSSEH